MHRLKSLVNGIAWLEHAVLTILFITLLTMAFAQVVLRNFFSFGIIWADTFLRHLVLWIGFIGASLATNQDKHISIDLITRFVKPRMKLLINAVTSFVAAIVCLALANAALTFVRSEREIGEILISIGSNEFPIWWFQVIIPVGFGLMALRFLTRSVITCIEVAKRNQPAAAPPDGPRGDA